MKLQILQKKYSTFFYKNFKYSYSKNKLNVEFHFEINGLENFKPKWSFFCKKKLKKEILDTLIFNLGMIELISYWKLTCSPKVVIECGTLSNSQIIWWKKLYKFGLGEFYYKNNLDIDNFNMEILISHTIIKPKSKKQNNKILSKLLVPIGGGKDSIVTLEILKKYKKQIIPYIIGNRKASIKTVKTANLKNYNLTKRTIDPKLIKLNKKGFLNGHTPFSAIVAFSSLIQAYINNCKYIILSNESSANEETLISKNNHKINHQYSKSFEFENDFRNYIKKHLPININYFSILRPLNELQIANIFSLKSEIFFNVFKSCNVGIKENKWCCNCAKCLFVYIILGPFL